MKRIEIKIYCILLNNMSSFNVFYAEKPYLSAKPLRQLYSSSESIVRRDRERFPALGSSTSYSFNGQSMIEIPINSDKAFLDGQQAFMSFEFSAGQTYNSLDDATKSLALGGVLACLRTARLSVNGTVSPITEHHRANLYYALRSLEKSSIFIESRACEWGDSIQDVLELPSGGTYSGISGNGVDSARKVIANRRPGSVGTAGTAFDAFYKVVIPLKELFDFFNVDTMIPLAFIKSGITIQLTLEDPVFVLRTQNDTGANAVSAQTYTIRNPEIIGDLIYPDQNVFNEYQQLFRTSGIHIPFKSAAHQMRTIAGTTVGSVSLKIDKKFRYVDAFHSIMRNVKSESTAGAGTVLDQSLSVDAYECVGSFLQMNCTSYQYFSNNPSFRADEVDLSFGNAEAFINWLDATNLQQIQLADVRSKRYQREELVAGNAAELRNWSTNNTANYDSNRFVMSMRMSKDLNDYFSGLNMDGNTSSLKLKFDTAYVYGLNGAGTSSDRYVHTFIMYSGILSLDEQSTIVRT